MSDVDLDIDCTSTLCLVPVDDIANGVYDQFQATFETAIVAAFNQVAATYINTISTSIPFATLNLEVLMQGDFALFPPGSANPNLVFYGNGLVAPSGSSQTPPFSPDFAPPDAAFSSPSGQITSYFTDYLIRSAIWALDLNSEFDQTITDSELPADSPIHLTTNDKFFKMAVPELEGLPNMEITVQTTLTNISSVDISATGATVVNTFTCVFSLSNSTYSHTGFTLYVDVKVEVDLTVAMNGSNLGITPSFSNWKAIAQLVSSTVGSVNTVLLGDIIGLALGDISPQFNAFSIPPPTDFTISSPVFAFETGYGSIGANFQYTASVPSVACTDGSVCAETNTCCNWTAGYGCCTYPSANCCPGAGCCPDVYFCCGDYCCDPDASCDGGMCVDDDDNDFVFRSI